jgi:hypothetical protein
VKAVGDKSQLVGNDLDLHGDPLTITELLDVRGGAVQSAEMKAAVYLVAPDVPSWSTT